MSHDDQPRTPSESPGVEIVAWLRGLEHARARVARGEVLASAREMETMQARAGIYDGIADDIRSKWPALFEPRMGHPSPEPPCMFEGCTIEHAGTYPLCPEHLARFIELGKDPPAWDDYEIDTDDVGTLEGFDGVVIMTGPIAAETGLKMSRATARTLAEHLLALLDHPALAQEPTGGALNKHECHPSGASGGGDTYTCSCGRTWRATATSWERTANPLSLSAGTAAALLGDEAPTLHEDPTSIEDELADALGDLLDHVDAYADDEEKEAAKQYIRAGDAALGRYNGPREPRMADAKVEILVADAYGDGSSWKLFVNGYGIAVWPHNNREHPPREYAEAVARALRAGLEHAGIKCTAASAAVPDSPKDAP